MRKIVASVRRQDKRLSLRCKLIAQDLNFLPRRSQLAYVLRHAAGCRERTGLSILIGRQLWWIAATDRYSGSQGAQHVRWQCIQCLEYGGVFFLQSCRGTVFECLQDVTKACPPESLGMRGINAIQIHRQKPAQGPLRVLIGLHPAPLDVEIPEPVAQAGFGGVVKMVRVAVLRLKEGRIDFCDAAGLEYAPHLCSSLLRVLQVFKYSLADDSTEGVVTKRQAVRRGNDIRHRVAEDVYLNDMILSVKLASGSEVQHPAATVGLDDVLRCRTIGVHRDGIVSIHAAHSWLLHAGRKQNRHTRTHRIACLASHALQICRLILPQTTSAGRTCQQREDAREALCVR